jgi:hypothetical protein
MNRILINTCCALLLITTAHAQSVGIGTNQPDASAALDITSRNKGLLIPRVDMRFSNILEPATGLLVYNTNNTAYYGSGLYINMGTIGNPQWERVASYTSGGFIQNSAALQPNSNFHISNDGNIEGSLMIGNNSSGSFPLALISNNPIQTGIILSNRPSGASWSILVNSYNLPRAFRLVDNVSGNTALISTGERVGVNMNTEPAATLDVNGDIKARGNFLIDMQYKSSEYSIPGNTKNFHTISCPSGYRLVSGGGGHRDWNNAASDIKLNYNGPDPASPSTTWRVISHNTSGSSRAMIIFCNCAKIQ